MKNIDINSDKQKLINKIKKYIYIIKTEYPTLVSIPDTSDYNKIVHIENTKTISLFVSNNNFYFPLDAYYVLESLKKNPLYKSNPYHKTYDENNLMINDNTFLTYIEHLVIKGCTPLEYFNEILLHEVMHFCGSNGADALMEGLNEYLTRSIALKYNLKTNGCAYYKEVKIINELALIFKEETLKKISFSKSEDEIVDILNEENYEAINFFFTLRKIMNNEFYEKYYQFKFPGLNGPFEKAKKYNEINYEKAYELIEHYKNSIEQDKNLYQKKQT